MKAKKVISFLAAACLACTAMSGCGNSSTTQSGGGSSADSIVKAGQSTPRNETLYINGLQWSPNSNSFNPMNSNPCYMLSTNPTARELTFETLYAYNPLDKKQYPLLADGKYTWNGDECTVKINKDAHWSDGQKLTADDVVYTFNLATKYKSVSWSQFLEYIDSVKKTDDYTVVFKEKAANKNPLMVEEALENTFIMPQHIWAEMEKKDNNDFSKLSAENNANPVASGPYKILESNDQKLVLYRDSKYWGQAKSMWGKLPAPKYIAHNIFKDNSSANNAFKKNEVDVSQSFMPNITSYGANVKTYLSKSPYYVAGTIPTLIFNTTKSGLDSGEIRKALAMCINYDNIGTSAMSGYTDKMSPSCFLPSETNLADMSQLKSLQWSSSGDVAKANALLDSVGAKKGSDGIRVYKGKKLAFKAECPSGWTDWNAALEVVANCAKSIGIDVSTYFPQQGTYNSDMQNGSFDMVVQSYQGIGISSPWFRAFQCMDSSGAAAVGSKANYNYGRYKNPAVDKLLKQIPKDSAAQAKTDWTELNKLFLTDVPAVGLMYRPSVFYTVNESVWTGFPVQGDNTNIPPLICMDGYGIAALYHIHAK